MSAERGKEAMRIFESLKTGQFTSPVYPGEGRPYGYTMRSWNRGMCGDLETWKKYVHLHRDLGFNNISIDVAWGDIEEKRGVYDFAGYDAHLRAIADAGLTLQIKLNSRKLPAWAKADRDALLTGPDGKIVSDGGVVADDGVPTAPYHGLADQRMIDGMQGFYRKVAGHCRDLPVLFYCSAFACCFESEYHNGVWTDYSLSARRQFREYLKTAYASLRDLNEAWRTSYAAWDEVSVAWQPLETMRDGLPDMRYVDFMKYREWSARRFFDAMHAAIKAGDARAEYGPQVGRIICEVGMLRGAIGAFHWAENCEWIFVDPAPVDDMAFEMAVARAGGRKVAVELDGPGSYGAHGLTPRLPVLYAEHTRDCYANGADYVCDANWEAAADYSRGIREGMYERGAAAKSEPYKARAAADAIYAGKWDSYLRKNLGWARQPDQVRETALACFQELRAGGKPADIVMDDTILQRPASLKQYKRIHLRGARFVARKVWALLKQSGAELLPGNDPMPARDETGAPLDA